MLNRTVIQTTKLQLLLCTEMPYKGQQMFWSHYQRCTSCTLVSGFWKHKTLSLIWIHFMSDKIYFTTNNSTKTQKKSKHSSYWVAVNCIEIVPCHDLLDLRTLELFWVIQLHLMILLLSSVLPTSIYGVHLYLFAVDSTAWHTATCYTQNKLVIVPTEWLPWLHTPKAKRDSGYRVLIV